MTRRVLLVEIGTPAELPVVTPPAPRPPSAWVPDPRPSPGLPPPTGLAAVSIADAAVLSWTPSTAGGQTIIEAAPDVAGVPGIWREVARVGGDTYTISLPGGPRWVRVRAELNGRTSVATNAVLAEPVPVGDISEFEQELRDLQDLVDAVAAQAAADAAALNVRADDLRADIDATIAEVSTLADLTDDLGTEITRVETESVARDTATVETISLLGAKNGAGTAWLLNMDTVRVSATETLAQWRASLQASFDDANARIDAEETARANADSAQVGRIATMEARMPSGSGSLATQASVTAEASARAAADSAQVGRIEVMEARMPSGSGGLATSASVTSVETASVNRDTALGQRIDLVEATADGAHSAATQALTAAGDAASAVTQVRSQQTGGGGNLLPNADFSLGQRDWTFVWNGWGGGVEVNLAGSGWHPPGINSIGMTAAGGVAGASMVLQSAAVPVEAGKRYAIAALLAANRCTASIEFRTTDASGIELRGGSIGTDNGAQGGSSIENFHLAYGFVTAQPGEKFLRLQLWASDATGATPFAWMLRPRIAEATQEQTAPPPWDPPAAGLAAVTQMLRADVSTVRASYGLSVTAGGDVAGMQLLAGGGTSAIRFLSETVGFYSSDGAFELANGRQIARSGGYMHVSGKPFGSTGDILTWYGPEQTNLNNCTKANGLFWLDNKGDGYFAGRVLQGVLRWFTSTDSTDALASVSTGSNPRLGKSVSLAVRYNFSEAWTYLGGTVTPGSGITRVTVQIQRRYGSGAWTTLATRNIQGVSHAYNNPGSGDPSSWNSTISGEVFASDSASTNNSEYRAQISGRTVQNHSGGTSPQPVVRTQYLSIEAME